MVQKQSYLKAITTGTKPLNNNKKSASMHIRLYLCIAGEHKFVPIKQKSAKVRWVCVLFSRYTNGFHCTINDASNFAIVLNVLDI